MSDMMLILYDKLKAHRSLKGVTIKFYHRPEVLDAKKPSLVIVPMAPPKQDTYGSDKPLRKEFTYQINIEARTKSECTEIACGAEEVLLETGFYQLSGGIDDFFTETERYVDVRRYRGYSSLYDTKY